MRNRYPGTCYRCGLHCAAGEGHFERIDGHWRVQHASCAIKWRGVPDEARQRATERQRAWQERKTIELAGQTGRRAQRARRRLRDQAAETAHDA